MKPTTRIPGCCAGIVAAACLTGSTFASSHMDAPLITRDPRRTPRTFTRSCRRRSGVKVLVTALGVYPHQEPGIGPNKYNFDDNVLYEIHVATGTTWRRAEPRSATNSSSRPRSRTRNTILQSYLGVVTNVADAAQNLVQTYTVTKVDRRKRRQRTAVSRHGHRAAEQPGHRHALLQSGRQWRESCQGWRGHRRGVRPLHRTSDRGPDGGYLAFAGQRDDGFYGDIQSIFDLLKLRQPRQGFARRIQPAPDGARHSRERTRRRPTGRGRLCDHQPAGGARAASANMTHRSWAGGCRSRRQGNPLFNEGLVAIADKDLYSRTSPAGQRALPQIRREPRTGQIDQPARVRWHRAGH